MSALGASCGKNLSSVGRQHSLTETVNLCTALLLRLKRHLHGDYLLFPLVTPESFSIRDTLIRGTSFGNTYFRAYCDTYYSDFAAWRQGLILRSHAK